ncbi:MAG TPA: XdhC family protein [Pirellulales bacterium]|nr:XdhC family protein [Pirellulales bacterium]
MRQLLAELLDSLTAGRPLVYCRLVETRGSTPQKAGAMMLVFPDGSQAGTLGGGCVEAEVKRRALAALDRRRAEVVAFQLDSDYGWDDGLICGGRMQVLIQPLASANEAEAGQRDELAYFRALHELILQGAGAIEAVVYDAQRSSLPAPGCYLFDAAGNLVGRSLELPPSGGAAPPAIAADLPSLAARPSAGAAHGVAYLPVLPRCRLLIVGGGHVGRAVGDLAADLDFDVWIVDDRAEYASRERFPRAERLIAGPIGPTLKSLEITPDTYAIIVTRGHNHDEEALCHLAERGARYVGLIGSRRKIKLIFDDLEAEGISREALARVHAPLGIDIGSQTVPEIAVSILAELIAHRNLGGRVPGRPEGVLAPRDGE